MDKLLTRTSLCVCKYTISMFMLGSVGCFDFDALTRGSDLGTRTDAAAANADLLPHWSETCINLPDGPQTLFMAADPAKPWAARCVGGLAYLLLARTGGDANYSQYTAGGYSIGQDVVTRYAAVRLDPVSLLVDVSDQTFSISSGVLQGSGERVSSMPYGVAMDCVSKQTATGKANIDLRDTPFSIRDNVFAAGGLQTAGAAALSPDGKVADLVGGGECGWEAAGSYSRAPINKAGGFQLPLRYGSQ